MISVLEMTRDPRRAARSSAVFSYFKMRLEQLLDDEGEGRGTM